VSVLRPSEGDPGERAQRAWSDAAMMRSVARSELCDEPHVVARRLLNAVLVAGGRAGRIVEVEAYGAEDDPPSHASRGWRPRSASMFAAPGTLYVYLIYGVHHCLNVVCHPEGTAGAVLVRGLEPLAGSELMLAGSPDGRGRPTKLAELCRGPGKAARALGIDRRLDGLDLLDPASSVRLVRDGTPPPEQPMAGERIGVRDPNRRPWRFFVAGSPSVSGPRHRSGQVAKAPDASGRA
jgi:DNA-3-methyladenine glycosylase